MEEKNYYSFNSFLKNKFNCKVVKIPLDAHASCPNKKNGGCIFCKDYSKSNVADTTKDLINQFNEATLVLNKKYKNAKYIAYFQTGTNTYRDLNEFKTLVEPFLNMKDVVGISVSTRSDSITDEYIDYFKYLNSKTFLMIELGLQTSNDNTLKLINRGHDSNNFKLMVKKLHENNIFVCAHIINGLINETKQDMLNTILFLNEVKIDAIKIHMLSILKDTYLAKYYENNKFKILSKDEYINIVANQISFLDKNIIIERLTADPIKEDLIEPKWYTYKKGLLNDINKYLKDNNIYQGIKKVID